MAGKEEITLRVEHLVGDQARRSYTFRTGPVLFGSSKLSVVPVEGVDDGAEALRLTFGGDGKLRVEALMAEPQLSLNKRYVSNAEIRDRDELSFGDNRYRLRIIKGFQVDGQAKDEGRGHTLEVAMFWGDSVLAVENYLKPQEIKVGETDKSGFFVPEEILGLQEYPLIRGFGESFYLNLSKKDLDGRILVGDEIYTLDEVRKNNLLKENAYLKITPDTKCRLFFEHLSLLISFTPLPAPIEKKYFQHFSLDSVLYFSISLLLHAAFLIALNLIPEEELRARRFFARKQNPMLNVIVQARKAEEDEKKKEEKEEKKLDKKAIEEMEEKNGKQLKLDKEEKKIEKDDLVSKLTKEEREKYNKDVALNTGAAKVMRQQTELISNLMNANVADWGGASSGIKVIGSAGVGAGGFGGAGGLDPFGGAVGMQAGGRFATTASTLRTAYGGGEYIAGLNGKSAGGEKSKINIKGKRTRQIKLWGERADVDGQLDRELIQKIIRRNMPQIKWCYQQALQKDQTLEGKVVVGFTISPAGRIIQTKIKQSTIHNMDLESCMQKKIKRWKFPQPKGGGIVIVNYPFILKTTE
jgi:TonB family protein